MSSAATQRLVSKRQTLDEAYAPPANFLEIEVVNPITHGVGKNRYSDYEVRLRVSPLVIKTIYSPVFRQIYPCSNTKNRLSVDAIRNLSGCEMNWKETARFGFEIVNLINVFIPDHSASVARQSLQTTVTLSTRRRNL